jgi:hypothetical protein
MEIGNLVKETIPSAPYINPPFAFPAPKEKHKCISAPASTKKNKKFLVRADGTNVHADGNFFLKKNSAFVPTGLASARMWLASAQMEFYRARTR